MIKSDFDVQIKLMIMYIIGVIVVLSLLAYLIYRRKKLFTKFTTPLMVVELVMIYILVTVIRLS